MRIALLTFAPLLLLAQDQPSAQPATAPAETPAPAPPPAAEPTRWITGTVDFGYRWVTDVAGSIDTYRSVVNLGEGPKLFGADLNITDPSKRVFDSLRVSGIGWGGDPYTTARVDAFKERRYRFTFDYRNIAFFDALPSFANPFFNTGIYLNQRAYDTRRRMMDFMLEGHPGSRLVPYLEYTRSSEHGAGVTDFVSDANEYPVANLIRSHTDHYRGGLRIEQKRFHVTLEEGAAIFKDDQQVTNASRISGNLSTLLLGHSLYLENLLQAYGIRGTTPYTRGLFTATPFAWLDFYGQFQYSQGTTDVNYTQFNTGSFVELSSLLFYTGEQDLLTGAAKQPHVSGSIGAELRPLKRLRVIENWTTDRLHTSSSDALAQVFSTASGIQRPAASPAADRLFDNYNQHALDVLFDVTPRITLRVGHRYVYGDTSVRAPFAGGVETGTLDRQSGIAGISLRTARRVSANFDFEGGSSNHVYYRTSLQDYRKYRARARYQALASLSISWNFSDLENENPAPSIRYDFHSRQNGVALQWTPAGGKRFSLLGEYTRSNVQSNILYIVPQLFQPAQSLYREDAHQASAQLDVPLPHRVKVTAGGALFTGSGSRPTRFYQPFGKLSVPLGKRGDWVSEWRWYGFNEPFYLFEAFRTTIFTTGLRLKL